MIMYKAVIFDLDGTLVDSLDSIWYVLTLTLKHFGLPAVTHAQVKSYIGNGARELVRLAIGEENADRLDEILTYYKKEYAADDNSCVKLFKGEKGLLKKLKAQGVKIAIFTNKPQAATLNTVEKFFEKFGLDCVQGQEDGLPLKPSPEGVYKIIEKLGVNGKDCLFVGDGETDVETAKNAGMD
ncbi:MAG: HAD family hydrolase, partial [Clostridia bacterium]|nr:HAD family hydrolase [Clostridia bacterium]